VAGLLASVCLAAGAAACTAGDVPAHRPGTVSAIGAENEYADVLSQIGGRYVEVTSILDNPNTDPHTFESSPRVAEEVAGAQLIVQNGLGYDSFLDRIEAASPSPSRKVIVVQHLLGLPDSTPDPHLWYDPTTMPAVARAIAADLSAIQPAHAAYFRANLQKFDASMTPLLEAVASFKATYGGVAAATTEPVADYLLQAMGVDNLTPFRFQADIMNGVDPNPQDLSLVRALFSQHQVKVFCYNQQVVSPLTASVRQAAQDAGVPVVGVYETMPTPGYNFQSWMLAEVTAVRKAVAQGISTGHL
jgi:zinc/manganese transport system substrate-binding protein